ncbi:hypothetical protein BDQ12DRAFT_564494, partial [Crucibulum laeve]
LLRSAKSACDWTRNELLAYNITIGPVTPQEFFSSDTDPSLDHLDRAILTAAPSSDNSSYSYNAIEFLGYPYFATRESQTIIDFAAQTLKLLGFNDRHALLSMYCVIPLTICGDSKQTAQAGVCLLHNPTNMVLLVLANDKIVSNNNDAEASVIAGAISAFQFNNAKRGDIGLPRLKAMTIPCITMSSTCPTFYLVPVTEELSNAVIHGQYPANQTRVLKCVTVARHNEGMEDAEYRQLALKPFLAFK